MNSAIHRGIVDPYWFFEDWDLSNLSLEVREVLKIQSESNETCQTVTQPNCWQTKYFEPWKLNNLPTINCNHSDCLALSSWLTKPSGDANEVVGQMLTWTSDPVWVIDIRQSLFDSGWSLFVYIYFLMKNLKPFTPQGCDKPVALVSPNCSQLVLDVLENSWDKSSSGLGSHTYVDSQSITDSDELQEYWEEYSV